MSSSACHSSFNSLQVRLVSWAVKQTALIVSIFRSKHACFFNRVASLMQLITEKRLTQTLRINLFDNGATPSNYFRVLETVQRSQTIRFNNFCFLILLNLI